MSPLRQVGLFFGASCVLTAVCQTPGILAFRAGRQPTGVAVPLMVIGACGPSLVAILMAVLLERRAGIRALFRRGVSTRRRLPLGLVALAHPVAAHLLASAALLVVGQYTAKHLLYPPVLPEHVAILVLAPLGEEYGWRGYALPRLQAVMSPLAASALIGVVWTLWHVPTFFMPGASLEVSLLFLPLLVAGSVIYTWLFNASGGSMFVIVLAHLGIHLDNIARADALGDGARPLASTTVVLIAFSALLVASGRLKASTAVTGGGVAAGR